MVRIMLLATRMIKLTIVVACLAAPFWTWQDSLPSGTRAFAVGGEGYRIGAKLTVIADEGGPVTVQEERSGEVGTISREKLHPIDFRVGP